MTKSLIERELKFDVDAKFRLPDLADVLPSGGRLETVTEELRSDYFDTADHALLRAHMTLRRRTGSTDVGWQLKIPHEPFREEIRVDLDGESRDVPEELRRLLVGAVVGQPLHPVASVTTERSVTRLLDADGRRLAEIDDDTVHASASGESSVTASSWREVEVELGTDEVELLYALGKRLRRAGARPSASSSKLARALPAAAPRTGKHRGRPRAGDVLNDYLAEQQQVLLAGDLAIRRGDPSVVHKTRVATRRLRSTLRVFGPLYEPAAAAELDSELRWYAGLLGEVRDRQVLRRRLDAMVAELDEAVRLGPVQARIDTELTREQTEHWAAVQAADRLRALPEPARGDRRVGHGGAAHAQGRPACGHAGQAGPQGRAQGGPQAARRERRPGRPRAAPGPQGGQACPLRERGRAARSSAGRPRRRTPSATRSCRICSASTRTAFSVPTCCAASAPRPARPRARTDSPSACCTSARSPTPRPPGPGPARSPAATTDAGVVPGNDR